MYYRNSSVLRTSVMLCLAFTALIAGQAVAQTAMDHSHQPVALPDTTPRPALSLVLRRDAMSGFNLELLLQRYHMTPPPDAAMSMAAMMAPSVDLETGWAAGHAHLYINGEKIQRLYGRHTHIPGTLFREGMNLVTVSINNHGHLYWTSAGRQILATLFIDTQAPDFISYRFESFPVSEQSAITELVANKL